MIETKRLTAKNKQKQRNIALEARRAIPLELRMRSEQRICSFLREVPEVRRARSILSYVATEEETSLCLFHNWARSEGKVIAFPVTYPNGIMEAFIPFRPEDMQRGRFGVNEPRPDASVLLRPEKIDLVIMPCVAFDEDGRRLGRGGGYYDRFLPGCVHALKVLVAFEAQRLPAVVTGGLDVNADALVTEQGIWHT